MVSLPKKLIFIPKNWPPTPTPTQPFIPFSLLQERKLIETQLISTLDNCTTSHQLKQAHAHIIRKGLDQSCYVLAKLIRMLTKTNVPIDPYPRRIFNQVHYINPFLYTALIRGYCMEMDLRNAFVLYCDMRRQRIDPVSFTFTALLKGCIGSADLGRQVHAQSVKIGGFSADLFVGNCLIDMYVKCGWLEYARTVFDEMPDRDVISWTSLIVAYAKTGDMVAAGKLFDDLPVKDMVAWTAMVTGFAQNGKPREALDYFERMMNMGVETDEVTLVGVVSACAQLGASKYANWVRDVAERSGFGASNNVVVGSALIDMYSKCGNVEEAWRVFEVMKERNVFSYSSMVVGFAMHGRPREALSLFEEMGKTDVKPNHVTFVGVLTACSHAGLVEQGRHLFDVMEKSYGVVPNADHYSCMIDLLGRVGRLEEALKLIKTMQVTPHAGVWGALLGACRIHTNPGVAEVAANHLFELEPDSIGNYILLSNIYASAGNWVGVRRVRKLMREKGLRKNPACSWIEGKKGMIHEFFAGDMTHPKSREIEEALRDLLDRLQSLSYEPNLSSVPYDVSDEDKKRILLTHSEKLALAYVILTTDAGSAVRIMKNLRICEDCHLFMCGASQITGREIVVRDNMRFHHFRDGKCSCGNFW